MNQNRLPHNPKLQRKKHDWVPCTPPCNHIQKPSDIPHRANTEAISFEELILLLSQTELGDENDRVNRWE